MQPRVLHRAVAVDQLCGGELDLGQSGVQVASSEQGDEVAPVEVASEAAPDEAAEGLPSVGDNVSATGD